MSIIDAGTNSSCEKDKKKDPTEEKKLSSPYGKAGFKLVGLDRPIMINTPKLFLEED